jgi:hypothetical protein
MNSIKKILEQIDDIDAALAHVGVKGMRWGVRKNRKQIANGPKSDQAAKVADILDHIKKNGIGAATNDDLKMLEQRIKLEVKYKENFPRKTTLAEHGFEFAKKVLIPVAEQNAKAFLNKQLETKMKGKAVVEVLELGKHSSGYGRHLKR